MKPLREALLLLLLAALPAGLAAWLHPKTPAWAWQRPAVGEVTLGEIARWQTPILLVDARSDQAYRQAHIPNAILCNEDAWEQHLPGLLTAWQPGTRIVVYCDGQACAASQSVALRLRRELDLTDIYVLQGGWAAWLQTRH